MKIQGLANPESGQYLPAGLVTLKERCFVHWVDSARLDLSFGFFRDSLKALPPSQRTAKLTPLEALWASSPPEAPCHGLIFHCARAGSTVLCQMLKSHPRLMVLGEPSILGNLFMRPELSRGVRLRALTSIVGHYGRWAQASGKHLVIKLSSWQIGHFAMLRAAGPSAAAIVLYRDPVAVMESLVRKPPGWLLRLREPATTRLDRAEAAYLEFVRNAVAVAQKHVRFMDYEELGAASPALLDLLDLRANDATLAAMRRARDWDAKKTGPQVRYFEPSPLQLETFQRRADTCLRRPLHGYQALSRLPNRVLRPKDSS